MTTQPTPTRRDYATLAVSVRTDTDRNRCMERLVDQMWERLSSSGVSWLGFYLPSADGELILGHRRDKPACSPIGLHGVCGLSYVERRSIIVRDVRDLGESYVACDPRDLSEVVVPMIADDGMCTGVLDLDSFEVGAFGPEDVVGLEAVLRAAGLTSGQPLPPPLLL